MVATHGVGWRLAPCLVAMVEEADRIAPGRSKVSDGSIGDVHHQQRHSDHNPAGGVVLAVDLTHDPHGGWDSRARVEQILGDQRLHYAISQGEIWSRDRPQWRRYTGPNGHFHHAHVSVHAAATVTADTAAWWPGSAAEAAVATSGAFMLLRQIAEIGDHLPVGPGSPVELVGRAQWVLNVKFGQAVRVDGQWGPETGAAVGNVQRWCGLPQSGVVDAATWKVMSG